MNYILMAVSAAILISPRTIVNPAQIKDWRQVSPFEICRSVKLNGTTLPLSQLKIDPSLVDIWRKNCDAGVFDHFRVSYKYEQDSPFVINCIRPESNKFGPGCESSWPIWFSCKK